MAVQRIAATTLLLTILAGLALGKPPENPVRQGVILAVQDADALFVTVEANGQCFTAWAGLFPPEQIKELAKVGVCYIDPTKEWVVYEINGKKAEFKP
jgi:hypothetical protein